MAGLQNIDLTNVERNHSTSEIRRACIHRRENDLHPHVVRETWVRAENVNCWASPTFSFKYEGDVKAEYLSYYLIGLTYPDWVVQSTKDLIVIAGKGYDKAMGLIFWLIFTGIFCFTCSILSCAHNIIKKIAFST